MSTEVKNTLDALNRAFEEFKQKNDERIAQVEKNGSADAVLTAEVENLNGAITTLQNRLTELETTAARPRLDQNGREVHPEQAAYKKAFNKFLRSGDEGEVTESGKRLFENAMSIGTDADGGYAVPEDLDRTILDLVREISPMRQLANVITVGTSNYRKLVNVHGAASGWVGETAARPVTNTSQLAELTPFWGEIYANPQVTQQALDDIFFNVEEWHGNEVAQEFAVQEGSAFVSGNGTNKPKGFLAYTTAATADGTRAFGQLQYIPTGVAAAIEDATHPAFDTVIDVVHSLKAPLRAGASWLMNSLTAAAYRKVKDGNGQYLWQPPIQAGQPATLQGYPVAYAEDMPDIAAGALAVAFGNFRRGYTIVDRMGARVLRDPFTNKPYVGFYTTKRVGGFVADSEAIKLIKVAAS